MHCCLKTVSTISNSLTTVEKIKPTFSVLFEPASSKLIIR
jgi:hypothetical protein